MPTLAVFQLYRGIISFGSIFCMVCNIIMKLRKFR